MPAPAPCASTKHAVAAGGSWNSAETRRVSSTARVSRFALPAFTGRILALIRFETRQQVFLEVRRLIDPEHVVDAQEILCESMKQWHQVAALAHDLRGVRQADVI